MLWRRSDIRELRYESPLHLPEFWTDSVIALRKHYMTNTVDHEAADLDELFYEKETSDLMAERFVSNHLQWRCRGEWMPQQWTLTGAVCRSCRTLDEVWTLLGSEPAHSPSPLLRIASFNRFSVEIVAVFHSLKPTYRTVVMTYYYSANTNPFYNAEIKQSHF